MVDQLDRCSLTALQRQPASPQLICTNVRFRRGARSEICSLSCATQMGVMSGGASGTGSVAAEQAARLGFGEIVLIDFDQVEGKNLNRILNSTEKHVSEGAAKVDVLADAIQS